MSDQEEQMSGQPHARVGADHAGPVGAMDSAIVAVSTSGRITAWNPWARHLLGYTAEEALGRPVERFLPRIAAGGAPPLRDHRILRALRAGVPDHADGDSFTHRDGHPVMLAWSSAPIHADEPGTEGRGAGAVTGAVIVLQDATERLRIEREQHDRMEQARRANSRLELVAEITTVLSSTLDENEVLRRLVRLAVPALGDWAEVDLLIPDGRVERVAATHREFSPADIAHLEGPLPPLPRSPRGPPRASAARRHDHGRRRRRCPAVLRRAAHRRAARALPDHGRPQRDHHPAGGPGRDLRRADPGLLPPPARLRS
ncbi:hypothetical protein GCM10023088_09070 [Actinomadura verrucosospora]